MKNQIRKCAIQKYAVIVLTLLISQAANASANWQDYYKIERVNYPDTVDPQIGGLTIMKDGRVALAVYSGDIVIFDPEKDSWSTFASGLHTPLGLVQDSDNSFVVMQKPELTRIVDKDRNGLADSYQTIYDDFGMSGNYHEFAFGPAVDSKGNYYISLNVASNFAGIYEYIRGDYSPFCNPEDKMRQWHDRDKWIKGYRKQVTRMFSCVPYRGWVMKISADGQAEPFASGFRSPAGLHVDPQDKLWVTDNQGDWIGTSPLHQVNKGDFAGHPASLHWLKGWQKKHWDIKPEDLVDIRKPAAALFPQGELANSPTQPLATISRELFGLPEGELLIGDMNTAHLIRYLPDPSSQTAQGTLIPFIAGDDLGIGNFKLDFAPDGSLWIGKIHLGWAGDEGLLKITKTDKQMFFVEQVKQLPSGFEITFNSALGGQPSKVDITSHSYHYHPAYGSEKVDLTAIPVTQLSVSNNGKALRISIPELKKGQLYTIDLTGLTDKQGRPLMGDVLRYNLNELVKQSESN
ncbi:hypothetical protein RS130_01990 [Paraglaciecola aquimarina]|uniref:Large, multifunctional secreted protein n=1 Tax=Paraglaciecola aquimarina TaxID=1235557 RepID=A0ABU3SS59_9ALTE|nr:hypothetical protein [Paraglaciecola aquimarina]MDU0352856.1 hypothetical protein [Paraglaciecola aquimarina]